MDALQQKSSSFLLPIPHPATALSFPILLLEVLPDVTREKGNTCATNLANKTTKDLILNYSALALKRLHCV